MLPFVETLHPDQGVIAFDAPGVGGSSTPAFPYRFRCLANIVVRVLDVLGVEQVDALGLSWGGFLAQQFALDHPQRCRKLVLAATSCGMGGEMPSMRVLGLMSSPQRYTDWEHAAKIAPEIYGGRFRTDPELVAAHAAKMQNTGDLTGYCLQVGAVMGWTSRPWLHQIKQPTLVMGGIDDPIIPLSNIELLITRIPNSQVHVVNDGHLFLLTQPANIVPVVEQFLAA